MIRQVELKKLDPRAEIPAYGSRDSAGVDLVACINRAVDVPPLESRLINTGLAINMQPVVEDCVAFIIPRSGKGHKEGVVLGNLTGVIDQDYQGELKISVWNRNPDKYITIIPGDRIAQLVFLPIIKADFKVVDEFSTNTVRGEGGFGSTG